MHLTGAGIGPLGLVDNLRVDIQGLLNALQAAQEWSIPRMSIASTIGVYGGGRANPFREDLPGEDPYLDITRIQEDTGYVPAHDIDRGIADYIGWLRAGHER